jgi:hypothetical protein
MKKVESGFARWVDRVDGKFEPYPGESDDNQDSHSSYKETESLISREIIEENGRSFKLITVRPLRFQVGKDYKMEPVYPFISLDALAECAWTPGIRVIGIGLQGEVTV